jgi:hypothetical protein
LVWFQSHLGNPKDKKHYNNILLNLEFALGKTILERIVRGSNI